MNAYDHHEGGVPTGLAERRLSAEAEAHKLLDDLDRNKDLLIPKQWWERLLRDILGR